MYSNFNSLVKDSRVWIFQSTRTIEDNKIDSIKKKIRFFLENWKSHNKDFKSSFEIRYNTFIIIAADESNLVSGCSIDLLMKFIQDLEVSFNLQLLDKLQVKYIENDKIHTKHLSDFKNYCHNLDKNKSLVVFNNLVRNIKEFESEWEVDIRKSWHNKYVT